MKILVTILILLLCTSTVADDLAQHLQDISVTIRAEQDTSSTAQGSGVIITRDIKLKADSTETKKVNFVWTAAHVISGLRDTREVIDPKTGQSRKIVQFKDASIVKELVEDGRRVGELKMDAQVIRYSDADEGEDLALLMIRKRNFVESSSTFYLKDDLIPIGTKLYHVGSLLGQLGANSLTTGIMSQVGRVVITGKSEGKIFDQTTATAFPGCIKKNSVIYTEDGYKKIIDLKQGDVVLTHNDRIVMADGTWQSGIKDNDQVLSFQTITGEIDKKTSISNRPIVRGKVVKVWSTGEKPIFKLSTRNKSIEATGNHPFVKAVPTDSINGKVYWIAKWCPLELLKEGDIIATIKEHTQYRKSQNLNLTKTFGPKQNHLDAMRLLGFYVGDGYSRINSAKSGEVQLFTFNDQDSLTYKNIVQKIIPNANVRYVTNKSGEFLKTSNIQLAIMLKDVGVTGTSKTKRVPKWIFTCPTELQKEFLEGLIDADGHRRRGCYQLELANKDLIEDVYALATNIGIGTSNISHRTKNSCIEGRHTSSKTWTIELYPNPTKQSAQMDGTLDLLPDGLKWERIAKIEPAGIEEVYDMEIESYHNFFANGFLVHNSSGGGVFLADGENQGQYIGMLVRGAGETFNLTVPIRRIRTWAKTANVEWALDVSVTPPDLDSLNKLTIEDIGVKFDVPTLASPTIPATYDQQDKFPFLIIENNIKFYIGQPTTAEETILRNNPYGAMIP